MKNGCNGINWIFYFPFKVWFSILVDSILLPNTTRHVPYLQQFERHMQICTVSVYLTAEFHDLDWASAGNKWPVYDLIISRKPAPSDRTLYSLIILYLNLPPSCKPVEIRTSHLTLHFVIKVQETFIAGIDVTYPISQCEIYSNLMYRISLGKYQGRYNTPDREMNTNRSYKVVALSPCMCKFLKYAISIYHPPSAEDSSLLCAMYGFIW